MLPIRLLAVSLAGLVLAPLASTQQEGGGLSFADMTATAGIALDGTLTESLAWGDYDGDGDEDLYLTNNAPNNLYRNDGSDVFADVTAVAGVGNALFSVGTAFGDLDNDGDLDLYVVNFGAGPDVLYRNNGPIGPGGETTFTDITASAGTTAEQTSRGMAFNDFDEDGLLDIFVLSIGDCLLYHNQGSLVFQDVAASLGVQAPSQNVGVVFTDIDDNGWADMFIGNRGFDPNLVFMNAGGTFTGTTPGNGITASGLGMGVLSFDYDNDLDFDLYYTTWPNTPALDPNALYENVDGLGSFVDVAAASGTEDPTGWGISCNAGDIDNDGWQDFFVTNGFSDGSTANILFHNQQDGTFDDVTGLLGGGLFDGRGAAFADYDQDGDLDLCVTSPVSNRLWRNDSTSGHHGITLRLEGVTSNRSAFGSKLEVTAGGVTTIHEVSGGAGRGSFNSLPVEVGLGAATTVDRIVIRWPDGSLQVLEDVAADQLLDVVEEDVWVDRNASLAGTGGVRPRLVGLGPLTAGSDTTLSLRRGPGGAPTFLVLGLSVLGAPFKGGTLVPALDVLIAVGALPGSGELDLTFGWSASIPAGTPIDFQYWFQDPGGVFGFAASNGLAAIGQ